MPLDMTQDIVIGISATAKSAIQPLLQTCPLATTLLATTHVVANNYLFSTTCSHKNVSFVYIRKVVAINISNDLSSHEYQYLRVHIVANNM